MVSRVLDAHWSSMNWLGFTLRHFCLKVRLWGHNDHVISELHRPLFQAHFSFQVGNQTFGVHWLKQWLDAVAIRVYSMGAGSGDSRYTLAKLHSSAISGLKPAFICSAGQLVALLSHCIHHASAHGQRWQPRWAFDEAAHHDSAQTSRFSRDWRSSCHSACTCWCWEFVQKERRPDRSVFILATDRSTFCFRLDWFLASGWLSCHLASSPLSFLLFKSEQTPSACCLKLRQVRNFRI